MEREMFWAQARREKVMLIDAPKRKLAVYQNTVEMLVLGVEMDGEFAAIDFTPDEIPSLIRRLVDVGFECATAWGREEAEQ